MKTYTVKEIYYTLQGEGAHAGRPAVFCRFSGCNLWSGREEDRSTAICRFCDTDFRGTDGPLGGKYQADDLAKVIQSCWPADSAVVPYIVCTGGEPLLQLDQELLDVFHHYGFIVAVETNGTVMPPEGLDWICMSPKANTEIFLTKGDELKLVYPQEGAEPEKFADFEFKYFFLQPMDGPDIAYNTRQSIAYCLAHPQWHISVQTHKMLQIP